MYNNVNSLTKYKRSEKVLKMIAKTAVAKRFGTNVKPVSGKSTYTNCVTEEFGQQMLWFNYDSLALGVTDITGCVQI